MSNENAQPKSNGSLNRVLQFGQLVVLGAVLPWGVWVTGQIYGLQTITAQELQWRQTRETLGVATTTDVELARLKTKDELLQVVSMKIDTLTQVVNEIDKRIREHDALSRKRIEP